MKNCLSIIDAHKEKIDGIKISLLDADLEVVDAPQPSLRRAHVYRRRLQLRPPDPGRRPVAIAMLCWESSMRLLRPRRWRWLRSTVGTLLATNNCLQPTVPLSRHIFASPTQHYKTGVVFLAYLNGFQSHFRMVRGAESARSTAHLCELFVLADQAGVLRDPELATRRMRSFLLLAGVA